MTLCSQVVDLIGLCGPAGAQQGGGGWLSVQAWASWQPGRIEGVGGQQPDAWPLFWLVKQWQDLPRDFIILAILAACAAAQPCKSCPHLSRFVRLVLSTMSA